MKKVSLMAAFILLLTGITFSAHAWEFTADSSVGGAFYEESEGTIDSDWSAFYSKSTLYLADYDGKYIEGEAFVGIAASATASESWDINSIEFQTNDMRFWGVDAGADIGWAFSFDYKDERSVCLVPMVGYRWKYFRFTRENFTIFNTINIRDTVDEDYNLHFVDIGGRASVDFGERVEVFIKPIFGIVVFNEADNSQAGTIDGDGGLLFDLDAGVNFLITENLFIGAVFTCELQRLKGGENGNVIWPNNALDTYAGTISVTYKFD